MADAKEWEGEVERIHRKGESCVLKDSAESPGSWNNVAIF